MDQWKRLEQLEAKASQGARERAAIIAGFIDEGKTTREVAEEAKARGIRSVAAQAVVVRLDGWHRLLGEAEHQELIPTGISFAEGALRPLVASGVALSTQAQILASAVSERGQLDRKRMEHLIQQARSEIEEFWDPTQRERQAGCLAGQTVVLNQKTDLGLMAWAKATDRFEAIDRGSRWGNPFVLGEDGDRGRVIELFATYYLPYKESLLGSNIEILRGKALGCWCYPEACHGGALIEQLAGVSAA